MSGLGSNFKFRHEVLRPHEPRTGIIALCNVQTTLLDYHPDMRGIFADKGADCVMRGDDIATVCCLSTRIMILPNSDW